MAFGETFVLNPFEFKNRFYNAVAMQDSYVLQLTKDDFERVLKTQEKQALHEKMTFIKTIPEFKAQGLTRNKLAYICQNMFPVTRIKGAELYKEGEPAKYLYFVKKGQVK